MLAGFGFQEVYDLRGGIRAWNGGTASGPVEMNLHLVREDETPMGILKLGYGMEQALKDFYELLNARTTDSDLQRLLDVLISVEEKHKTHLLNVYTSLNQGSFDAREFEGEATTKLMEGGFQQEEFLQRNATSLGSASGMLDLSMMLETQALDLYLRFAARTKETETKNVLYGLADEEKSHLKALGNLREERERRDD